MVWGAIVLHLGSWNAVQAHQFCQTAAADMRQRVQFVNAGAEKCSHSRGVLAVANINGDVPFFEQPFGYVTSVPVALAPSLQCER